MTANELRVTEVVHRCAHLFDVRPDEIMNGNRTASHCDARHVTMVVCRDAFGMSASEIAKELGQHRGSVTNAWVRMDNSPDPFLMRWSRQLTAEFKRRYPSEARVLRAEREKRI